MDVHAVDPVSDPRWTTFVDNHPRSSIFHTRGWLEAIRATYGYVPVAYTTSPPSERLTNGVAACGVRSWLTGKRLVSVPFADHCDLLTERQEDLSSIFSTLTSLVEKGTWKYVELRPPHAVAAPAFQTCNSYVLHTIDLRQSVEQIFGRLHKDSNQRKIRKAEREGLAYVEGRSEELLGEFYRLHLLTRRRHRLPPQPIGWFRNLMATLGDKLTFCTASKDGRAIGSIITLRHRDTLVYKYGASDASFHNRGTMPLIFWRVMNAGKNSGAITLDLGRSDPSDNGLITFKDRLGADRTTTTYAKYSHGTAPASPGATFIERIQPIFAKMPDRMLVATGHLLYKHIG